MAQFIQIIEGDLGTCQNIESLRKRCNPSGFEDEGLRDDVTTLGSSHTLWNFAQSMLGQHWGSPNNSADSGAWKSWVVLLGGVSKLPENMDFARVMRVVHMVHKYTLVSCLTQVEPIF